MNKCKRCGLNDVIYKNLELCSSCASAMYDEMLEDQIEDYNQSLVAFLSIIALTVFVVVLILTCLLYL
jgi:hypothetical protein